MVPTEIFLSHSGQDHAFAATLAMVLRDHGVPVWYSGTDIVGAQQWHDEIGAALARCDWFLVVLTARAVESMWVKRELQFALQQPSYQNRIVPVVLEDCDQRLLSWVLPSVQSVDFSGGFEEGCRALLRVWGIGFRG